jgi:hypothetical protein
MITTNILDIIPGTVFYSKHDFLVTRLCLRMQVEPTQFGPLGTAPLRLRRERLYLLRTKVQVSPQDGDSVQSPKLCILNITQDDGQCPELW